METRIPLKPVRVNIVCDECSQKPNPGCVLKKYPADINFTFATNPPTCSYFCPLCDKKFMLNAHYPYIEYEEELSWD